MSRIHVQAVEHLVALDLGRGQPVVHDGGHGSQGNGPFPGLDGQKPQALQVLVELALQVEARRLGFHGGKVAQQADHQFLDGELGRDGKGVRP